MTLVCRWLEIPPGWHATISSCYTYRDEKALINVDYTPYAQTCMVN